MTNLTRREAIAATAVALSAALPLQGAQLGHYKVLVVAGPTNHPPGTHEIAASARLLKHAIEAAPGVLEVKADAEIITEWPKDGVSPRAYTSVVFVGDLFPAAVMKDSDRIMKDLTAMMAVGTGMVCLHYATGLEAKHVAEDGSHPLLEWIGGYFATRCKHHQSVAKVFPKATIEPAKLEHPVLRGVKPFTIHDEPYINNYFGKDGPAKNVTILCTSELPPEKPKKEAVAWAVARKDGGRGVGIVMPHFYKNWNDDNLRKLILNAIIWSATNPKVSIHFNDDWLGQAAKDGIGIKLPDLDTFEPASVEPVPKKK
jgi:type 1 glutamine amidotransferase